MNLWMIMNTVYLPSHCTSQRNELTLSHHSPRTSSTRDIKVVFELRRYVLLWEETTTCDGLTLSASARSGFEVHGRGNRLLCDPGYYFSMSAQHQTASASSQGENHIHRFSNWLESVISLLRLSDVVLVSLLSYLRPFCAEGLCWSSDFPSQHNSSSAGSRPVLLVSTTVPFWLSFLASSYLLC